MTLDDGWDVVVVVVVVVVGTPSKMGNVVTGGCGGGSSSYRAKCGGWRWRSLRHDNVADSASLPIQAAGDSKTGILL